MGPFSVLDSAPAAGVAQVPSRPVVDVRTLSDHEFLAMQEELNVAPRDSGSLMSANSSASGFAADNLGRYVELQ